MTSNDSVPQPCTLTSVGLKQEPEFVSVKQIAEAYGISKSLVYELIKNEKGFPGTNIGRKKKYIIHLKRFQEWLKNRQQVQEALVPTGLELIRRHCK